MLQGEDEEGDEDSDSTTASQSVCPHWPFSRAAVSPREVTVAGVRQGVLRERWEDSVVETSAFDDISLDHWRKTSGMHTVENWCQNYTKHPAGWGALLMIHGIPEVTGRLRSKVESYAIYAALFVSGSVAMLLGPPDDLLQCKDLRGEVLRRIYFYSLIVSLVSHVLCIFLAMGFCSALNEAARDADVIRMFAEGEGFKATVKVMRSFKLGVVLSMTAIGDAAYIFFGLEAIIVALLCIPVAAYIYTRTINLLLGTGSIVTYWRAKEHESDPYDLTLPVECLHKRVEDGWTLLNYEEPFKNDTAGGPESISGMAIDDTQEQETMRIKRPAKPVPQSSFGTPVRPPKPRFKIVRKGGSGAAGMNKQARILPMM